jgi:hypothetical protein
MEPFTHTVNPGKTEDGALFVTIAYTHDGRLSITGVEGPKADGDAKGGCGQCTDALKRIKTYSDGWSAESAEKLYEVWERWHLNDMRAGCAHQRAAGWRICQGHYAKGCDVCGGKKFVRKDGANFKSACKACGGTGLVEPAYCAPGERVKPDKYRGATFSTYSMNSYRCTADRVGDACPECGYKFGTAWLFEEVPEEVLTWLSMLPSGPGELPSAWARVEVAS